MTVGKITHHCGTEVPIILQVKTKDNELQRLTGFVLENTDDLFCDFYEAKELERFASEFMFNLIFDVMAQEWVEIHEWEYLAT